MLGHSHTDHPANRKKRHQLGTGGQASDVRPPIGIPLIGLELVKLTIDVKRDQPSSPFVADSSDAEYDMMLEEVKTIEPNLACPLSLQKEIRNDMLFDGRDTLYPGWDFPTLMAPDAVHPSAGSASANWKKTNAAAGSDLHPSDLNTDEQRCLDADHLLELIDAALRLAICDKPAKLSRMILKVQDDCSPKLATLAPSPTYSNVRSSSLRSKLTKLPLILNSGVYKDHVVFEDAGNPSCVFDGAVVRLWLLLQRRQLNVNAAKQLRPLSSSVNDDKTASNEEAEILEKYSPQISPVDEELHDDQDLFDTGPELRQAYADDALVWGSGEISLEDEETEEDLLIEEDATPVPLFGMNSNWSVPDLGLLQPFPEEPLLTA
ncbi:hypothetical protein K490DRAFT_69408 [Saccharata proteae CBS 121410]|uniref:Uncharacterized protein n=1 Tax=Saccharata proteae CBS 121410 TaxID=1314787 RepID=A0A9P4HLK6_9PEZI|nr:hypothetical protein K490DRAFT_69408 [Saccharata proteae CBS 121410]